ncbi:hypothetical protein C0Q70_00336 [Pomacea canaliculata]|uniref:Uncharacterized protein n=1 Tax=Pomacea canaliculata TaxID=400727 RepID=A0A2T7PWC0_POMCA|nr:hypothetical protein C0Q70_00336 [Pomacea canaliculata]
MVLPLTKRSKRKKRKGPVVMVTISIASHHHDQFPACTPPCWTFGNSRALNLRRAVKRRRDAEIVKRSVQNFPSVFTFERLLAVVQNRHGSCGRSLSDSNESTPALILHIGRDSLWWGPPLREVDDDAYSDHELQQLSTRDVGFLMA